MSASTAAALASEDHAFIAVILGVLFSRLL
jgi:hypothetical protein